MSDLSDLIAWLSRTTYLRYDDAARLVTSGLALGWTVDELRPYGDRLPDVIALIAAGFSKAQIAGWRDKLPFLLMAYRSLNVDPRDVPETPPRQP